MKKGCKDVEKIKKYGKVLYFNSPIYYLKYLNSVVVISSHIDNFIHKPFGRKQYLLSPFIKRKFVFLQHGVIQKDLSGWLNKSKKNISLFITSSALEYNSILSCDYLYDKSIVKLTGLPRYDNLLKDDVKEENLIALMPTWRSNLVGSIITGTQNRQYNPAFKKSDYFNFYNGLINDEKVLKLLKKHKYKILFCLHPSLKAQLKDFEKNDFVDIVFYPNYSQIFKKSKFMITDYSSVFFDFAYLKKPILYYYLQEIKSLPINTLT